MLKWLNGIGRKPSHPMHNAAEADRLLSALAEDPADALEELATYLGSVATAGDLRPADRIAVVKLIDETGQPVEHAAAALQLDSHKLREFGRLRVWEAAVAFRERAVDAYRLCLSELEARAPKVWRAELPLAAARALRNLAGLERLLLIRYRCLPDEGWQRLAEFLALTERGQCDAARVQAYADDALPTTPRHEFAKTLMLDAAGAEGLLPYQVEIAARVVARFGDAFPIRPHPEAGCNWCFDLEAPARPGHAPAAPPRGPGVRFFGAGIVLAKIEEVLRRLGASHEKERRFGEEFSNDDKRLVLNHLLAAWRRDPPRPLAAGRAFVPDVLRARGFAELLRAVTRIEPAARPAAARDGEVSIGAAPIAEAATQGHWLDVPNEAGPPLAVGTPVALRALGLTTTWVGTVRRAYSDRRDSAHAAVEIIARRPVAAWVRPVPAADAPPPDPLIAPGTTQRRPLNVIFLGDAGLRESSELLLAGGIAAEGAYYEALVEPRLFLQLREIAERGPDHDRVRFAWIEAPPI